MQAIDFILETLGHAVRQDDGPPPGISAHVTSDFEQELTWLCEWHSVTPIIVGSLERLALRPQLSRITIERLRALTRAIDALNNASMETARLFGERFADAGLDVMFSNIAFADGLYPARYQRPIERVAMMIRESDWVRVITLCADAGFHRRASDPECHDGVEALRYYQYFAPCILENESGDQIRITFRLFDMGEPEPDEPAWARKISGENGLYRLGLEDQLIRACIAYNVSGLGKLLHATDIGMILKLSDSKFDWEYVSARLESHNAIPSITLSMERAVRLLKTDSLPRLPAVGAIRRKMHAALWRPSGFWVGERTRAHRLKFYLLETGRLGEKLHFFRRLLWPKREWVSSSTGKPYRPWRRLQFVLRMFRDRSDVPST